MSMIPGNAMLGTGLAGELYATSGGVLIPGDPASYALCDWIAAAVIAHIVANAEVVPTLLVASPSGGPVTGTGNVT